MNGYKPQQARNAVREMDEPTEPHVPHETDQVGYGVVERRHRDK